MIAHICSEICPVCYKTDENKTNPFCVKAGLTVSKEEILEHGWIELHAWGNGIGTIFGHQDYRLVWLHNSQFISFFFVIRR